MADIAYRTADVDGLTVFYREAGAADAPTLVLLHGFPSASHMFRGGEHVSCMVTDAVSLAFAGKRAGGGIPQPVPALVVMLGAATCGVSGAARVPAAVGDRDHFRARPG
jgi:pimeloyl-ACP methyl ester carboxylesterase